MMEQVKGKWIIYKKNKAYVSALILDNNLEKIQIEPCVHHQIGSIYIGKIQKIVKNIQAAFVEIAEIGVGALHVAVGYRIVAEHMRHIGLGEQIAFINRPLLFEVGLLVGAVLLGCCASLLQRLFVLAALLQLQAAGFLRNQRLGYLALGEVLAQGGAVLQLAVALTLQHFHLRIDFFAVDFGAVYGNQGLCHQAAGKSGQHQGRGKISFFHVGILGKFK